MLGILGDSLPYQTTMRGVLARTVCVKEQIILPSFDLSPTSIAVTGATGHLGGSIANKLAIAGIPQTLIVRDAARAPKLPGAKVAVSSYADAYNSRKALEGVSQVLMVPATESPQRARLHQSFIDAASDVGVAHLTYVSFYGASPGATYALARDHWDTEQHLRASGLEYTILRSNIYADIFAALHGEDGIIRAPAGSGRLAPVARNDVADAAVAVLKGGLEYGGSTYDLTGPEALTFHEIAQTLSAFARHAVSYHPETPEEAYKSRTKHDTTAGQLTSEVSTYIAIANGELDGVSADIVRLAGHPAMTFQQYLECRWARLFLRGVNLAASSLLSQE